MIRTTLAYTTVLWSARKNLILENLHMGREINEIRRLWPYAVLAMGPRYASRMHRLKAHPHASQPPQAHGRSMHTRRERERLSWALSAHGTQDKLRMGPMSKFLSLGTVPVALSSGVHRSLVCVTGEVCAKFGAHWKGLW